ncbi:MAG: BtrH N-terminal domain-containing protein [Clostridiales bacterium]|nr:BtrH N-terminal domain-containing protein [Clostridiales bacterium]
MGKILPFNERTDINGYLIYTYPYGILNTHSRYQEYLMEHYINCFGYINSVNDTAFKYDDGVGYSTMCHDTAPFDMPFYSYEAGLRLNVRKFIISAIDNDYYPIIFTDEYYLKTRPAYKKEHNLHEIMITGYDDDTFRYYAFNDKFKLSFAEFPQKQLNKAYRQGSRISTQVETSYKRSIVLMKLKDIQNEYTFSSERFRAKLEAYSKGEFAPELNSFFISKDRCYIGVYNTKLLQYCLENPECSIGIRYPSVHTWCESKKNLLTKLKYYAANSGERIDDALTAYENEVVKQAELIRIIMLKYRRCSRIDAKNTIVLLDALCESEKQILARILKL